MDQRRVIASALVATVLLSLAGCVSLPGEAQLADTAWDEGQRYRSANLQGDAPDTRLADDGTLAGYLAYAAIHNPGLEAEYHRWIASLEEVPQVTALPEPLLSFGYFIREVETKVGPQRWKIEASQMFPWRGKRELRGNVAIGNAKAAHARYEARKLALFNGVEKAYWEYAFLARLISVTDENRKLLTYLEEVARAKYTAGRAPHSAVMKAQVELARLEDRLTSARDLRAPRSAALAAATGLPPGKLLPWPTTAPDTREDVELEFDTLIEILRRENPELTAAAAGIESSEAGLALSKRQSYPDIGFGLGYVFTDYATGVNPDDNGKDPIVAAISLSLPLARAKYRAAERQAEARHAAALNESEDRENKLAADLQMALYGLRDSQRKIDLYRDTLLPKARQSLEVATHAFEGERADFLDIIDAQRSLLEFDLSFARALTDRAISLTEIGKLIGRELRSDDWARHKDDTAHGRNATPAGE